jgi:hypothetical protein
MGDLDVGGRHLNEDERGSRSIWLSGTEPKDLNTYQALNSRPWRQPISNMMARR